MSEQQNNTEKKMEIRIGDSVAWEMFGQKKIGTVLSFSNDGRILVRFSGFEKYWVNPESCRKVG